MNARESYLHEYDKYAAEQEIGRAIHAINGALDILECHADRLPVGDNDDAIAAFGRMGNLIARILEIKRAA